MSKNKRTLSEARVTKWAETAKCGDTYIYHKGISAMGTDVAKGAECAAAWELYERGEVVLFQRHGDGGLYDYIAVRVRSPQVKRFVTEFSPSCLAQSSQAAHVGS